MIKADLLVNLEELKHYEILLKIAIAEQISLFEAIDFVLSKVEIIEEILENEKEFENGRWKII